MSLDKKLLVSASPHDHSKDTVTRIMLDVVIALVPSLIAATFLFGFRTLVVSAVSVGTCVLAEYISRIVMKRHQTVGDISAIVTGLLIAFNVPVSMPLWMVVLGDILAIVVVKQMFGGLGYNFANPAMTARIVLLVSFAGQLSVYSDPFTWASGAKAGADVVSSATPMAGETVGALSFGVTEDVVAQADNITFTLRQLFFGMHPGCIGETSSFLLMIGGLYLIARRVIKPIIPVSFIGTVAVATLITGIFTEVDFKSAIFGGGLMLGAIFMATDYVTSPTTNLGKLIFGIGCGLVTFVIRQFSPLPEGVSYAILLMNIITPHINRFTLSKPFGYVEVAKNE